MKKSTILGAWTKNLHKRQLNKKKKTRAEEVEKMKKKQIERITKKNKKVKEVLLGKRDQEESSYIFSKAFKKLKPSLKTGQSFIENSFHSTANKISKKNLKIELSESNTKKKFFSHFDFSVENLKKFLVEKKIESKSLEEKVENQIKINPALLNSYVVLDTKHNEDLEIDDEEELINKEDPKLLNYVYNQKNYLKKTKINFENFRNLEYLTRTEPKPTSVKIPEFPILEEEIINYLQNHGEEIPSEYLNLLSILSSYTDFQNQDPYSMKNEIYQKIFILHVVNHILTKKRSEKKQKNGYTKPSVLILAPYRIEAFLIFQTLKKVLGYKKVLQEERFKEKFADENEFMNDEFKLGISIDCEKKVLKLYTNFKNSDLILASPLGLKMLKDPKKLREEPNELRVLNYSFLSSLEVLYIEKANVFSMQNIDHLTNVLKEVNKIPDHGDTTEDFTTIKPYYFENLSKFFRQNIITTEYNFPTLNSLEKNYCLNYKGIIKEKISYKCIISDVLENKEESQLVFKFNRIDLDQHNLAFEQKFNYFCNQIWPEFRKSDNMHRVVLFSRDYFEFVKLKKYLKSANAPFESISEYTEKPKVQSILSRFNKGKIQYLLITERAHFFKVVSIKNFENVFFYSFPQNQGIFRYLVMALNKYVQDHEKILGKTFDEIESGEISLKELKNEFMKKVGGKVTGVVSGIFSKFDFFELERIFGSDRVKEMVNKKNKISVYTI